MSRKLENMKSSLKSHILQAIEAALSEKVIPRIQLSLKRIGRRLNAIVGLKPPGLRKNREVEVDCGKRQKQHKTNFTQCKSSRYQRESSLDSQESYNNTNNFIGSIVHRKKMST